MKTQRCHMERERDSVQSPEFLGHYKTGMTYLESPIQDQQQAEYQ